MNKVCVDYHYVAEGHETIHTALENWARWVRVKPSGWQTVSHVKRRNEKLRRGARRNGDIVVSL